LQSRPQVFILEGWSLGYAPVDSADSLREAWSCGTTARTHPLESIQQINDNLRSVEHIIGAKFACHVLIKPQDYVYVYTWRQEQEDHMRATNGGRGMDKQEVKTFVDRYMPVYEVFGDSNAGRPTLRLLFDEKRRVIS
jgi:D-glycerate 3-kinase